MSLQGVIERIRSFDELPNEEAVILQIVLPILRELGWIVPIRLESLPSIRLARERVQVESILRC